MGTWFTTGASASPGLLREQDTKRDEGDGVARGAFDDTRRIPQRRIGRRLRPAPTWTNSRGCKDAGAPGLRCLLAGPALDRLVAPRPSRVPTMWIKGLWDQEDIGARFTATWLKAKGSRPQLSGDGPWRHSQ